MNGVCRLTIKSATLEDSGEYICKINKQTDKTETVLTVVGEGKRKGNKNSSRLKCKKKKKKQNLFVPLRRISVQIREGVEIAATS